MSSDDTGVVIVVIRCHPLKTTLGMGVVVIVVDDTRNGGAGGGVVVIVLAVVGCGDMVRECVPAVELVLGRVPHG